MTPEEYQRVRSVFHAAAELDPSEAAEYVARTCAHEPEIRSEVERLLASESAHTSALDPERLKAALGGERATRLEPGQVIGHYRLIRRIGVGGMGVVYEAEQDSPRRTVALKVINAGVASASVLGRFEYEAQVLGNLQHPGIAQIYESGTFDSGDGLQPYFAMELVRGRPLVEYATVQNLDTPARLSILARVCEAVQHAHQRGVIHRDLKPANILVDDDGQPKVLDFGVARTTDSDIRTTTVRTNIGQLVGTVPYMSPEQASGEPDDLDTRSDVYALGVIAYELLAGRLPHDVRGKMVHEAVRMIREDEPAPLSTTQRVLRGDVETIVGKALEKDRTRRYQSAMALAEDIDRYLNDQPIAARPPSLWYQTQKFARRHKVLVASASIMLLVLVAGVIVTSTALARALAAEKEARDEAQAAAKVTDFMVELFAVSDPSEARGNSVTAREILDRGSERIATELEDEPLVRARLMHEMGRVYDNLGLSGPARTLLEDALRTRRDLLGDDDPRIADTLQLLATAQLELARYEEAEAAIVEALEIRQRHGSDTSDEVLEGLGILASVSWSVGDNDRAVGTARQVVEARRAQPTHRKELATALQNLGMMLLSKGDAQEAVPLLEESTTIRREIGHTDHPGFVSVGNALGLALRDVGQPERAETLLRDTVELTRKLYGDDNANMAVAAGNLALVLQDQEKYAEAEENFRLVLAIDRAEFGNEHPYVATDLDNLAILLHDQKDVVGAEPLYLEALEVRRATLPEDHPQLANSLNNLAQLYKDKGDYAKAETWFEDCIELRRRVLDEDHPYLAHTLANLGEMHMERGDYAEAEPLLVEAYEIYIAAYDNSHTRAQRIVWDLKLMYARWGKPQDADVWSARELPEEP